MEIPFKLIRGRRFRASFVETNSCTTTSVSTSKRPKSLLLIGVLPALVSGSYRPAAQTPLHPCIGLHRGFWKEASIVAFGPCALKLVGTGTRSCMGRKT